MSSAWPELPLDEWKDTYRTLHMWTQVIGKIRLKLTPLVNHWWNVPLYVSARGLTTTAIPYRDRHFAIDFDFVTHKLRIRCSDGQTSELDLRPMSVATFYAAVMEQFRELDIHVRTWTTPVEIENPIPFEHDRGDFAYDPLYVERCWAILASTERVFQRFRGEFIGKSSPVHFFWGSFDLAVTRFNGELAPERPSADSITLEAYSHANISCGWWPGAGLGEAAYYAYAAPEPAGYGEAAVEPVAAFYSAEMSEFFLPYEAVRLAQSPENDLLRFMQSSYAAAADLAGWDRPRLERRAAAAGIV